MPTYREPAALRTNNALQEAPCAGDRASALTQALRAMTVCRGVVLWLTAAMLVGTAAGESGPQPAKDLGDLSLEQLMDIPVETVFSASKYEQKTTRAPASVSIVTADEIAAFGHRTLADVLRSVRGLYVSDDSNYSYLGVRGFLRPGDYNTRVLVLLDGHRLNDNIYDSVYYGHEMLDVGAIDRVEIVRGPSSSVYGSNAFFGVINLVSKRGRQLDSVEVTGDAGTFGTYSGRLSYGKRFAGDAEVFLSASYYDSRGRGRIYYPELDQRLSLQPEATNNGVAENSDAERAVNFVGNVRLGDFTVSGFWSARMKQVPTASFSGAFNDPRERTDDDRGYVDLRYDRNLSTDVQLHSRAYWDYYSYYGDYPDDGGNPGSPSSVVISKDAVVGKWVGAEAQVTAKILSRHTLVAGVEYRQNLEQKQVSYFDTLPLVYDINDNRRSRTFALYAQGEITLHPDLLLNAGLRYDDYSDVFGGTLNPRLGLVYNPAERTTLKVLYGEAFRAPNVYERFYYPNPTGVGLRPERIHTTEVTLEQDFARHYRLSLSAYRYNVRDLISQSPATDGFSYYANLDHATATGAECELEGRFAAGLRARASYAFQRSEDLATHEELTNSPRHLAKLGVIYPFSRDRFTAGVELQYQGTVRTLAGAATRSFLLGNLTLTARVPARNLEISASAYNLFDTHYVYPGSADHTQDMLPQPGRTFRLKVTTKF